MRAHSQDRSVTHPDLVAHTAPRLLTWYRAEHRKLPWRAAPGALADPYRVWLSEVMLQQTTVKVAAPYFERFTARWPTVADLAAAPRDDVMAAWAGLGYYARAANLHACAQRVAQDFGGRFPETEAQLVTLPGIGPYTAAAIAAMAFGAPATPVDGNIERVMSRLFARMDPLPGVKPVVTADARALTPERHAGDFAQALMDLGSTVCTPKKPSCLICPIESLCRASAQGIADGLPRRSPKQAKPIRRGVAFVALREDGCVLLRRRPATGLLANMLEVPSTAWEPSGGQVSAALKTPPIAADWWTVPTPVIHVFTHFRLELTVLRAVVGKRDELTLWADQDRCVWTHQDDLEGAALPTLMRKALNVGLVSSVAAA